MALKKRKAKKAGRKSASRAKPVARKAAARRPKPGRTTRAKGRGKYTGRGARGKG